MSTHGESDYQLTAADRHAFAQQIVAGGKAVGKNSVPPKNDLAAAIIGATLTTARNAAPTIVLTLADPTWALLDSGFFDTNGDGKLDPVKIQYPADNRFFWVLSTVSPSGSAFTLRLTFIPRLVWAMQQKKGPKKSNRAATTRARFLRSLVLEAAREFGFEAQFYSRQLDVKQAIASVSQKSTSKSSAQADGQAHKTSGVSSAQTDLTCRGVPLTDEQKQVVNVALGEAQKQHAPTIVAVAMIYAGMGESSLSKNDTWQNSTGDSTETEAHYWLAGGHGFQQGGGIACARNNPGFAAWQIANAVEANRVWNDSKRDSYAQQTDPPSISEAEAIVQAGGFTGMSGGSFEEVQPYYFQVGTSSTPNETYWAAALRIAQEVNWDFIIDGDRAYYDSEMTLITQKVAAVVSRGDDSVQDWNYDWETRNIATNFNLTLLANPFDFWSGDVFQVKKFGTASSGSTAKRPGCWLVDTVTRDKASLASQFVFVQPTAPKKEPAPATKSVSTSGGATSTDLKGLPPGSVARAMAAAQILSNAGIPYSQAHRQLTVPPQSGGYDCSASVSWVLWQAGMYNGPTSWAWVSGDFERWGDAGPGRDMTVWCNADHVFIEFHPSGGPHMQLNTSVPGVNGPHYAPWGPNGSTDASNGAFVARHWPGA